MSFDWTAHKKHRAMVQEAEGQWVGLLDNNGVPIMDMAPIITMDAPRQRMDIGELNLVISTRSRRGVVHPVVDELVGEGVSAPTVDANGKLTFAMDEVRFIAIERGGLRQVYFVTLCVAHGDADSPTRLEIKGVELLDILERFPCPSFFGSWKSQEPEYRWREFVLDWAADEHGTQRFKVPRTMRPLELASRLDGFAHQGPAVSTIHHIIEKSLECAYFIDGGNRKPLVLAPLPAGTVDSSPNVIIAPRDKSIWAEIEPYAKAAGVNVDVSMWWPGDNPVAGLPLEQPTAVVTVSRAKEA